MRHQPDPAPEPLYDVLALLPPLPALPAKVSRHALEQLAHVRVRLVRSDTVVVAVLDVEASQVEGFAFQCAFREVFGRRA